MLIMLAVLYWTFAIAVFAIFAALVVAEHSGLGVKDFLLILVVAVFWPFAVIAAIPIYVYQATVASTKRIRTDLHNRKLLREFENWLKNRKGEIQPKE